MTTEQPLEGITPDPDDLELGSQAAELAARARELAAEALYTAAEVLDRPLDAGEGPAAPRARTLTELEPVDAELEGDLARMGQLSRLTVTQAIGLAVRALNAVAKNRQADAKMGGYAFRGIDAVIDAVHPVFGQYGIVILPRDLGAPEVTPYAWGNNWQFYRLHCEWTFIGPAGDMLTTDNYGEALDNGDKGLGKARSYAEKDLLTRMLTLPTNDPDADTEGTVYPTSAEGQTDAEADARAPRREQPEPEGPLLPGWDTATQQNRSTEALKKALGKLTGDEAAAFKAWRVGHGLTLPAPKPLHELLDQARRAVIGGRPMPDVPAEMLALIPDPEVPTEAGLEADAAESPADGENGGAAPTVQPDPSEAHSDAQGPESGPNQSSDADKRAELAERATAEVQAELAARAEAEAVAALEEGTPLELEADAGPDFAAAPEDAGRAAWAEYVNGITSKADLITECNEANLKTSARDTVADLRARLIAEGFPA